MNRCWPVRGNPGLDLPPVLSAHLGFPPGSSQFVRLLWLVEKSPLHFHPSSVVISKPVQICITNCQRSLKKALVGIWHMDFSLVLMGVQWIIEQKRFCLWSHHNRAVQGEKASLLHHVLVIKPLLSADLVRYLLWMTPFCGLSFAFFPYLVSWKLKGINQRAITAFLFLTLLNGSAAVTTAWNNPSRISWSYF